MHFLGLKNLFQNGPFHTSSAIIDTSMFFLIRLIDEAGRRTFQLNEWVGLFFGCFAGSQSFCVSSCSSFLFSTFLTVSQMYDSWQEHTPS